MGSNRPVGRGRGFLVTSLLTALAAAACAPRPPRLVPPSGGAQAIEGFGSAAIAGAEASVKGRFGFVFRRSGLGRIEASDPIGRTVFIILFREGRAWFVLPGRKAYAEDAAPVMMGRFLGVALDPREAFLLLSGTWGTGAGRPDGRAGDEGRLEDAWELVEDAEGRVAGGRHGGFSFTVRSFFPGDGVPREIAVAGDGVSGRVKVLKLAFDPATPDGAFDAGFLGRYAAKTWDEILELIER
jgi:hypothetical protein